MTAMDVSGVDRVAPSGTEERGRDYTDVIVRGAAEHCRACG